MRWLFFSVLVIFAIGFFVIPDVSAQEATTSEAMVLAKDFLLGNTDLNKYFGSVNFGSIGGTDHNYDNISATQIATQMGIPLLTNGDKEVLAANLLDKMVGHDSSTMEGQARNQQAVYKIVNVMFAISKAG